MAVKKFDLTKTTTEYLNKHERLHLWQRIVSVLSCIVVFCTTYALIIPAITLEKKEPICGIEAHIHEDNCCIPLHVHTEECYQPNGSEPYYSAARPDELPTYCGYADFVIHEHDFDCYDGFGELICGLPQISEHRHDDGNCVFETAIENQFVYSSDLVYPINDPIDDLIYDPSEDSIPSVNADGNEISDEYEAGYVPDDSETDTNPQEIPEQDELPHEDSTKAVDNMCVLPEVEYHLHTSECFSFSGELICGMTQVLYRAYVGADGETMVRVCGLTKHEHIDSCYPEDREPAYVIGTEYFCGIGEHIHTDTCYDAYGYLVCTLPAHIHTDECLEPQVSHDDEYVCGMVAHLHTVKCLDENGELVCEIPIHIHTAECLPPEYYCGLEDHIHRFYSCYDEDGRLICELEEHEHDQSCMIDSDADDLTDGEYGEQGEVDASANAEINDQSEPTVLPTAHTNDVIKLNLYDYAYYFNLDDIENSVMNPKLVDGYPQLLNGENLGHLFSDSAHTAKLNRYSSIDGLFLYDSDTGVYSYNGWKNFALFVYGTNENPVDRFIVYDRSSIPTNPLKASGNFLPLNDIVDDSANLLDIDTEVSDVSMNAQRGSGEDVNSIGFKDAWGHAVRTTFSMDMKLTFMQAKDGRTETDLPTVFTFSGDECALIYVDDYLFLDLSDFVRNVGGQIDFEKGEVRYYGFGDERDRTVLFADILGVEDAARLLNDKGTFEDYSLHTLRLYYITDDMDSTTFLIKFNLEPIFQPDEPDVPDIPDIPAGVIVDGFNKVEQYGDPVEGARFDIYPADENYNYDRYGEPVYTGVTDSDGSFEFINNENTYYSIDELQNMFGNYFVMRQSYTPDGYRIVSDEIRLYIENGIIKCANTYNSGAWASPNALVTAPQTLDMANGYDSIQFVGSDGNLRGTLFAVVLKRNDNPLPGNVEDWECIDYDQWYPVYGSDAEGYTVVDYLEDPDNNLREVLAVAKEAQRYGNICFSVGSGKTPRVLLENLPGSPEKYLSYILENNDGLNYNPQNGDDLEYVIAYYYTTEENLDWADVDNTYRITSHFTNTNNFNVAWGSTILVPSIENRLFVEKTEANEWDEVRLNDAVFAMYRAGQDSDGNVFYYASDPAETHIYLTPSAVAGNNRGRAGLSPDSQFGSYAIYTDDIKPEYGELMPFIKDSAAIDKLTGGDIEVSIDNKTYIIKPAVNADHDRLVTNSHEMCPTISLTGTAHFTKLLNGRYILREIMPPEGYSFNNSEIKVVVNENGVYANAGEDDNYVLVGNAAGYLAGTADEYFDNTMMWIYSMLRYNGEDSYDVFNPDGSLISDLFAKRFSQDRQYGVADRNTKNRSEAMVSYLMYNYDYDYNIDSQTLFDYFPNPDQDRRVVDGKLDTRKGEGTMILYTETGWSELAIYQDYYYGIKNSAGAYYEDLRGVDLTPLISSMTFVRITNKKLGDMTVVKVDSEDTDRRLSGAEFVLYCCKGQSKYYYWKQDDGEIMFSPIKDGIREDGYVFRVDDRQTIEVDGVEVPNPDYGALDFEKLPSDVYYLEEVTAPVGYQALPIPIKITVDNGVVVGVYTGELDLFELDDGVESGDMVIYIKNRIGCYLLPHTGSFGGTLIFTIGGLLLIAAPFVYTYRRRKPGRRVKAR